MRRVLPLVAVTACVAAACSSYPGGVGGSVELTMEFDDVGDLVTQHSVQVADVRVGSVTKIELTDENRARKSSSTSAAIASSTIVPASLGVRTCAACSGVCS